MTVYEKLQLLQAVCLLLSGLCFFLTLLYIAASPVDDEPRPAGWWKPKRVENSCKVHQMPPHLCKHMHEDD